MDLLLFFDEVDHLATFAKTLVIAQIMIERKLDDSPRLQGEANLAGSDQVSPTPRERAALQDRRPTTREARPGREWAS